MLSFVLWFTFIFNSELDITSKTVVFVTLVIIAIIYISAMPIIDMFLIQRNTAFCITNKRAIVLLLNSQIKVKYAVYKEVSEFDIDMISAYCGNVYIGSKAPNSLRRSRSDTLMFPGAGDQPERPLVFYNIENPYQVAAFLK